METQLKACVTAVVVLCVTFAAAYEIQATHLNVAATSRTSGSWLWRPHHAINFNDEGIAVKVSHGPAHCTESTASLRPIGLAGKALNRSLQECPFGVLMSGDGGLTWEPAQVGPYFCGSLGTLRNSKLYCPGQRVTKVPASLEKEFRSRLAAEDKKDPKKAPVRHQLEDRPLVVYEEWEYELIQMTDDDDTKAKRRLAQAAGESFATTNAVIRERTTGNYVAYDQTVFASSVKDIRLGGAGLWLPERQLHLRNVELTLENTTKLHAFYRSVDGGSFWTFVSFVPVDFSAFTVMLRLSDTRVQLISGEIGNMNQTSSLFLGNKWEKSEKAPFVMPSSYYQGRYQSMVASGVVPRPSLGLVAIGTKKNSQQSLLLSAIHNNATQWYKDEIPSPLTPKNYSKDFALATTYDCIGEGAANTPAAGCECSGFIAVVAANANNSVVVLYDRLVAGHRPTAHKGDHTIFALRLYMNETVEQEEYELKLAQEAKAKQQEKEAELLAAKRREELRLKKEKDAADKKRRNKARRAEWKKLDEGAQRLAKQYESLDGQWIVVRPALDEYVDIEKEMF